MSIVRRMLLTALPKFLLSRTTGMLTHIPLPRFLRSPVYRLFSWRYGVDLREAALELRAYPNLAEFFQRALKDGARPVHDTAPLVWPCDGKIISSRAIEDGKLRQVKGQDYSLIDFVQDPSLAESLAGGSQASIYLLPKDYHRVHVPFDAELLGHRHVKGSLFPVNPGAVRSIPQLFLRNERVVFSFRLKDGRAAALVMVAALNVGDIHLSHEQAGPMQKGEELARFGFGSTTVVLMPAGEPVFAELTADLEVRMGEPCPEA